MHFTITKLWQSACVAMLITSAGCMASSVDESTGPAQFEKVATTKQALHTTTPLFDVVTLLPTGGADLNVATCPTGVVHDGSSDFIHPHPCDIAKTGAIEFILVRVYGAHGGVTDVIFDRNIHADGPGGGCIHDLQLPTVVAGDRIQIDGLVFTGGRYEIRRATAIAAAP